MNRREVLELSDGHERSLVRLLQLALVGILAYGIYAGSVGIAVNAAGALVVSVLPALLSREFDLHADPGIVLLITTAVLLHAIGITGPYRNTSWWDTLTHAFSGLVVTGIGYAAVRAIDEHTESIEIPDLYMPVFLLIFALATGVLWEVVEFTVTKASSLYGGRSLLIVFGPGDIVTDLIFTGIGGLVLALWARGIFRGLADQLTGVLIR